MTTETQFYRPATDVLPTVSLALAVSLAALNFKPNTDLVVNEAMDNECLSTHHAYYDETEPENESIEQIEALQRFAHAMLAQTEETPQPIVEMLNKRFWDLV
jgi:hypothetical protein